jgi:signal peptidase II
MFNLISKNFFLNFSIIIFIFILDRISKIYVIKLSEENNVNELFSSKYLDINLIWNEGIAFGLLSFENDLYYNSITFLIMVVILILLFLIRNHDQSSYFYSMIIGGALGNLTDRIRYSSVPDFIDFHIGSFHWFIFNVSDIFISTGVILMILIEIIFDKNKNYE